MSNPLVETNDNNTEISGNTINNMVLDKLGINDYFDLSGSLMQYVFNFYKYIIDAVTLNIGFSDISNIDISNTTLSLDPKYKFIQFFSSFFKRSTIILLIVLFNSNIIFLIKSAKNNKDILTKFFPSDCLSAPYGPRYIMDSDGTMESDENNKLIVRPVCERIDNNQVKPINNSGASWPYTSFNSDDKINPVEDYINFVLRSMASTNTTVNSLTKKLLGVFSKFSNKFILIILGLIILFFVGHHVIPAMIYSFLMFVYQLSLFFSDKTSFITKCLILISIPMFWLMYNHLFAVYETICLLFKLILYPMFAGHSKEILKIIIEYKALIGFFLGYNYILCAKQILPNPITNVLYFIYIITLIGYIYYYAF
jgi:hypothetical protein